MSNFLFGFDVIMGYLMGSICSAIIVSRLFSLPDPRTEGSKNPGATNVLRLSGKKYAIYVLLGDVLKGLIPVLIARLFHSSPSAVGFTCFSAVLGHIYPVFFGFKGGKGVATTLGALFGLNLILGLLVTLTWLVVANFSRYSSLASITAVTLAPFFALLNIQNLDMFPPLIFISAIILYKHKNNIARLMNGEEPKIEFKKSTIAMDEAVNEAIIIDEHKKPEVMDEPPKF